MTYFAEQMLYQIELKNCTFGDIMNVNERLEELISRYPVLAPVKDDIFAAYEAMRDCFANGGKLLVAGNGGSAADAEHIVGELMKGFVKQRPVSGEMAQKLQALDPEAGKMLTERLQCGLPAIALDGHPGLATAFLNDVDGQIIFAQQVFGYGKPEDVLLGISTSGNSGNIVYAMLAAKAKGMKTIGLLGRDGGRIKGVADISVIAPEKETFKIQELHLPIYHCLCLMLEEYFFEK